MGEPERDKYVMAALKSLLAIQIRWRSRIASRRYLRDRSHGRRSATDRRVEARAEMVGDQPGFGRADPFHVRVIRQEVCQPIRRHLLIEAHAVGRELPPVLRMVGPLAFQANRIIPPGEHLARKSNEISVRGSEAPGAERRARVENSLYDSGARRI